MSDLMMMLAWSGTMFGLGVAAGWWFAHRRLIRRKGRRTMSLR
jgi:hypothetical protein